MRGTKWETETLAKYAPAIGAPSMMFREGQGRKSHP